MEKVGLNITPKEFKTIKQIVREYLQHYHYY